ncbi:MAG: DUF2085 domain-containing protein [Bacteroidota bacterium]
MTIKTVDILFRRSIFVLYFLIFSLAWLAPVTQHVNGYPAGENLYSLFSPVCHQYPTRSFWIFDRPWALCARCSSAYLGLALASFIPFAAFSYARRALFGIGLIILVAIDPLLQLFGFYESTNLLRFITGLIGGFGAFLLIYPIPFKQKERHL